MKDYTKKIILLVFILMVTLFLNFISLRIYSKRLDNLNSTSNIKKYLTEINYDEISTHLIEVPNSIIYVSNSSDDKSTAFEKEFIKVIKKYNLENEIIYININNENIVEPFYQNAPQLLFYKDSSINDIVDCSVLKSKKDIINILNERGVIGD